jgi:hypothetical protein
MTRFLSKLQTLLCLVRLGECHKAYKTLKRCLYSDSVALGLRRDLLQPFDPPTPDIPLKVRPVQGSDIPVLFDPESMELLRAGIGTWYVATTLDGRPCFREVLLMPSDNRGIQAYFGGLFPVLEPDEALVEQAFTAEEYRGRGIYPYALFEIGQRAMELGARWLLGFIDSGHTHALKGCKKAGRVPYMVRSERWRFFRRRIAFRPLMDGETWYPFVPE